MELFFSMSVFLYFLSCLAIFAIFLTIALITRNKRQLPRRLFRHFAPCPFGTGTDFKITDTIRSVHRPANPDILFTIVLFGKPSNPDFKPRYLDGLSRLLRTKHRLWPSAQVRLYVSQSVLNVVKDEMLNNGVDLYIVSPDPQGFEATLWRFWAFDDSDGLPVLSFDADDDIFDETYIQTIKQWLASDKPFFVKRQWWHKMGLPINACRIGAKAGAFQKFLGKRFSMTNLTKTYCDTGFGVDEGFLNREVWPVIQANCFIGPVVWTEYTWILIGGAFVTALCINAYLGVQGSMRVSERWKKKEN